MRNSIIIALALTSSFALTACGNGKHSAKAKVAAAKALGDKGTQKKNAREINNEIQASAKSLADQGYHGLEDGFSLEGAFNSLVGMKPEQRANIKKILGEVKGKAEALIEAGKDMGGSEGDDFTKKGQTYIQRANSGIEKMNREEKSEQEKQQSK